MNILHCFHLAALDAEVAVAEVDVVDEMVESFLTDHEEVMAKSDEVLKKLFLRVQSTAGNDPFQCPCCSLSGPRNLMINLHLAECLSRYGFLTSTFTDSSTALGLKRSEPERSPSVPEDLPNPPARSNRASASPLLTPVEELEEFTKRLPSLVDPGQCLYDLNKHSAGSGKISNKESGINIFTPNLNQIRVCNFSHFKKAEKARVA